METKRLGYLDGAKGLAAVLVALGHTTNRFAEVYGGAFSVISPVIYSFHMPLFIFLSGMIFALVYQGNKKKTGWSILNLAVLYLVYDAIFVAVKTLIGGLSQATSWSDLLYLAVRPVGELWYLYVLILFYAVFSWKGWRPWMLAPLFALSALSTWLFPYTFTNEATWLCWQKVLFLGVFFYGGMVFAKGEFFTQKWVRVGAFAVAAGILLAYNIFGWEGYRLPGAATLVGMGMTLGCVGLFRDVKTLAESKIFGLLGKHAIDIYLIHLYVIEVLWRGYTAVGKDLPVAGTVGICAVSVGVSLGIAWILEKIKLYDLFFRPVKFFRRKV